MRVFDTGAHSGALEDVGMFEIEGAKMVDPENLVGLFRGAVDYARSSACFGCGMPVLPGASEGIQRTEDGRQAGQINAMGWRCHHCGASLLLSLVMVKGGDYPKAAA